MKSKWYVAQLIMRCKVGGNDVGPWTCDEQIRVLRASTDEQAYEKALQLAKEGEITYDNEHGETVSWDFVGLADLEELSAPSIRDGTEITSRLFTEEDPSRCARPKQELTVYWAQRNRYRTAAEIITKIEGDDMARDPEAGRVATAEAAEPTGPARAYLVVTEAGPDSYGAYVPELPGCIAAAETREEVVQLIQEALPLHLEGMRQNGDPIPPPTSTALMVTIPPDQP